MLLELDGARPAVQPARHLPVPAGLSGGAVPTHPALPGGHAAIAGAGVTVLKAFFNEVLRDPQPGRTRRRRATTLQPLAGEPLTVGGELDKLASNLAFGRDTAGVHFRRDELQGIYLGETNALTVLVDDRATYHEPFEGFTVTTVDGSTVTAG